MLPPTGTADEILPQLESYMARPTVTADGLRFVYVTAQQLFREAVDSEMELVHQLYLTPWGEAREELGDRFIEADERTDRIMELRDAACRRYAVLRRESRDNGQQRDER